jgi:hypothetical protein
VFAILDTSGPRPWRQVEDRSVVRPTIPTLEMNNTRQGFFERAEFDNVVSHLPASIGATRPLQQIRVSD